MRITVFFLAIITMFLTVSSVAYSQNERLSIRILKKNDSIYNINDAAIRIIDFHITGISSQKRADNLFKFIRSSHGVEEFNLTKSPTSNTWRASRTLHKYAEWPYFNNRFKVMKVTEVCQNNINTTIDN